MPVSGALAADVSPIGAHPKIAFPTSFELPLKISVALYLIDFSRINGREETFDLQGYLIATWVDPALATPPGEKERGVRRLPPDQLWTPNYEFTNAAEQVKVQNEAALLVDDRGQITQRLRFVGKFSWPMDLKRFPFDTQRLAVLIEPFERDVKDVVFVVDTDHVGLLDTAFLTDWKIDKVGARAAPYHYKPLDRISSRIYLEIQITRRSTFYVWRVLLPLTLLVISSWVVYRFEPSNLQPQISTTIAILLNVILFNFSIDFALPKVAYLTLLDTYAVSNFFYMLVGMILVTVIHITYTRDGLESALALQRKIRKILPIAFAATLTLEVLIFLL
jgi:hypothetical protein